MLFPARFIFTWTKLWEPPKGTGYKNSLKKEKPLRTNWKKKLGLDHFSVFRSPHKKKKCFFLYFLFWLTPKGSCAARVHTCVGFAYVVARFPFHFGLHNNYIRTAVYSDNQILTGIILGWIPLTTKIYSQTKMLTQMFCWKFNRFLNPCKQPQQWRIFFPNYSFPIGLTWLHSPLHHHSAFWLEKF